MSNFLVLYLDSRGYMYTKGNIFINKFNYLNIKYSVLCKNKVIIQYFHFFFFFLQELDGKLMWLQTLCSFNSYTAVVVIKIIFV